MVTKTRGLFRPPHMLGTCCEDTQGSKGDKNLTGPRDSRGLKKLSILSFPWILITNQLISVFPIQILGGRV